MQTHLTLHPDWKRIDRAALGLIYGAILVLGLLMALEEKSAVPYRPALVLFWSVLAVTLAKAFSELLAHALQTHERFLTQRALTSAWRHSHPTLTIANVPTLVILAAGYGLVDYAVAVAVSQLFCVAVLVVLGARVGWAIRPGTWLPVGGAVFVGGIGSALAALKYAFH